MSCYGESMAPWLERDQPIPYEMTNLKGMNILDGDQIAHEYHQAWAVGKQYPILRFPSEVEREILPGGSIGDTPYIHITRNLYVPYHSSRDAAFASIDSLAQEGGYILSRERDARLRIASSQTGRSTLLTFDNEVRTLHNLELFPDYAMDLMPGGVRAVLPPLRGQESKGMEAVAPVKYFTPDSDWTWYATEYDGEELFFSLVSGYVVELGYFSLTELESVRGGLGLPLERDLHYEPQTLQEIQQAEWRIKGYR